MNQQIETLLGQALDSAVPETWTTLTPEQLAKVSEKFADLIYRNVIASILITDIVMEEKGQTPTSEDYIRAINKDFGVEE